MFSVKDSVLQSLRSRVVYKFSCAGCNASYIGETTLHICARVREHLLSDKSSHVYRHLQSSRACHDSCTAECFTILGPVQTPYLSCAVPNTFSLLGRIKRQALPFPETLACLIEICRKKLIWTPYNCQKSTYYLVRHTRGTASELGLRFCSLEIPN